MTTRVLLTGAGGFVGSHILEELLTATDWHVVSIDSLTRHNGSADNVVDAMLATQAGSAHSRVTHITHDLTVPFSRAQVKRIGEIHYIINVASLCQVDASIANPRDFISNNVGLQLTMLELTRELKPLRFIHMSTDEVYGPGDPQSTTDHRPSSPYAASKAAQEDISRAYSRTYVLPLTIVNSANMFGERQSQLAFIPRVVDWIKNGETIPVHYAGDKPGGRHYTYVRNVAERIVRLLIGDVQSALVGNAYMMPGRLTLSGQEFIHNVALVDRIAKLMGKRAITAIVQGEHHRPGYDPAYSILRGANWQPIVDVDTGLAQTVRWLEER